MAFAVGVENGLISLRGAVGQPGEQSGPDVEADAGVIVDDADDAVVRSQNAGGGVGSVTLGSNALVPVVVGVSGVLLLDDFEPRVLARRLIKMTVNTKITVHMIFDADYEGMMNSEGVVYCERCDGAMELSMQLWGQDESGEIEGVKEK
ncbi:MAG: hypothetical protein WBS19_10290 [Candidatus Korobacteraceae bacterium]